MRYLSVTGFLKLPPFFRIFNADAITLGFQFLNQFGVHIKLRTRAFLSSSERSTYCQEDKSKKD
jgi:hypothetical protein